MYCHLNEIVLLMPFKLQQVYLITLITNLSIRVFRDSIFLQTDIGIYIYTYKKRDLCGWSFKLL